MDISGASLGAQVGFKRGDQVLYFTSKKAAESLVDIGKVHQAPSVISLPQEFNICQGLFCRILENCCIAVNFGHKHPTFHHS